MYTTQKQKFEMRSKIVLDKEERKNIRNFMVSRRDWNGGKKHRMRIHTKRAYQLIELGFTVTQAIDQTWRKPKVREEMPKKTLL